MTSHQARSGAVDCVRVIGIIAIVVGHVWANDFTEKSLYSWHVPLFFFLTGYFWTAGRTLGTEVRNRFKTLMRPYLLWLAVLLALVVARNWLRDDLTPSDVLLPLYGGWYATRPFSAFWFVTALLSAALGYRMIERLPVAVRWTIVGAGLLAGVVAGDALARIPLSIGLAWPCLVFIAVGAGFRALEPQLRAPLLVGALCLLAAAGIVAGGWSTPPDIKQGDFGTPVLSVVVACGICAGLVLVAKQAFTRVPAGVHRTMTMLAKAGFVVILFHAALLMLLNTTRAGGVDDFLVALLLPWALGLLLLRTRLSAWATGMEQIGHRADQERRV